MFDWPMSSPQMITMFGFLARFVDGAMVIVARLDAALLSRFEFTAEWLVDCDVLAGDYSADLASWMMPARSSTAMLSISLIEEKSRLLFTKRWLQRGQVKFQRYPEFYHNKMVERLGQVSFLSHNRNSTMTPVRFSIPLSFWNLEFEFWDFGRTPTTIRNLKIDNMLCRPCLLTWRALLLIWKPPQMISM